MKKKILFIGIGFYEYDKKIFDEIRKNNCVDYFSEEISYNFFEKIITKTLDKDLFFYKKINKIEKQILKSIEKNNYDELLVIKSNNLTPKFYKKIKELQNQIKLKLYLWDDIERVGNFKNIWNYFDKIYTFDLSDSKKYKLEFKPLFYIDEFAENIPSTPKNTIYFSGWNHSDRLSVLGKILEQLKKYEHSTNIYIYIGLKNYIINFLIKKNKNFKYFRIKKMEMSKNIYNTKNSKILIDIQHPTQNGLTMRTIEAIGAKCKLITTNNNVKEYEFYNVNNILVVDRENPKIDEKFIEMPYVELEDKIYEKYSLSRWVKEILE